MILDLYPTRLYWVGHRGVASLEGKSVRLISPPHLPGLRIEAIDFIPEPGGVQMVMPKAERWRDLEPAERDAAMALIRHLVAQEAQT